jgi:hypothetical protein
MNGDEKKANNSKKGNQSKKSIDAKNPMWNRMNDDATPGKPKVGGELKLESANSAPGKSESHKEKVVKSKPVIGGHRGR